MSKLLDEILAGKDEKSIALLIKPGLSNIPLFTPFKSLQNKTLFEHLARYKKIKAWSLEKLILSRVINPLEKMGSRKSLVQLFICNQDIFHLRAVLLIGVKLSQEDYKLANGKIKSFLDYRPGRNQQSIFKYCSIRGLIDSDKLQRLFLDEIETTDGETSEAESMSEDELSSDEEKRYRKTQEDEIGHYNKKTDSTEKIILFAARGMHFCPSYFKPEAVKKIRKSKKLKQATYSASTLFDAGYCADDEPSEEDPRIIARHKTNLDFISKLKKSEDQKEKSAGRVSAPASRNKVLFKNLYYRFMQTYINSYARLFTHGAIQSDFGFDTQHNPEISASWNIEKAMMYGSGIRIGWRSGMRKNPHYRRSTGQPKHPNLGYVDIYAFKPGYVRQFGFDRYLTFLNDDISLSSLFRHEEEIIFHSIIPAQFHARRCIITAPSFSGEYDCAYYVGFGINAKRSYTDIQKEIYHLASNKTEAHKKLIDKVIKKAVSGRANSIEKTMCCRFFREWGQVKAYDAGKELSIQPPKP